MKSGEPYEAPQEESQPNEQVVEFSLLPAERKTLVEQRIQQLIDDLDRTYQIELNKLAEISVKLKQKIDESKTKTKDSYYTSKLTKNNEKIYDALVQYNKSRDSLLKLLQEKKDAGAQEV